MQSHGAGQRQALRASPVHPPRGRLVQRAAARQDDARQDDTRWSSVRWQEVEHANAAGVMVQWNAVQRWQESR